MTQSSNPFMNAAFEMQKQWSETFTNLTDDMASETPDLGKVGARAAAKAWSEGMQQAIDTGVSASAAATNGLPELLAQIKDAASSYSSFVDAWNNSVSTENQATQETETETPKAVDWLIGILNPEARNNPFKIPGSNGPFKPETWQRAMGTMAQNWAKFISNVSNSTNEKMASQETQKKAVSHFYDSWLKGYESTVGRFVNFPLVGPNRYEQEKVSKSADTFMKYQAAVTDFQTTMVKTGFEALQEVIDESKDLLMEKEITKDTTNKVYHLLMSVGERRYHELFSSPLFCQSLESLTVTGLEFKKAWNDMTEESLKSTPIVTQTQADEMHKEIYLLKKRVSQLERLVSNRNIEEK